MNKIMVPHSGIGEIWDRLADWNLNEIKATASLGKGQAVRYACAQGLPMVGMNHEDAAFIWDLLQKKGACKIVELGRNYGCSTRMFIQHVVNNGGSFESWDLCHMPELMQSFLDQGFKYEEENYCKFTEYNIYLRGANSMTTEITEGRWVDFLLIDTEHGFENAHGEYQRWKAYFAPKAIVVFHDADLDGVKEALRVIREQDESLIECEYEAVYNGGYGVVAFEMK